MKRIILMVVLSICLFSCSNESRMESEVKRFIEKSAEDPESYELIALKIIDTVTIGKVAKDKIDGNINYQEYLEPFLMHANAGLELRVNNYNKNKSEYWLKEIQDAKILVKQYESKIAGYDKENALYSKFINSNEIMGYVYFHKFRMKNRYGALNLFENYVNFDKDLKVVGVGNYRNYKEFKITNFN